ncbi:LacI family DNA-binding transcriptional regulator [Brachybacterium fresconis]|uniref:LacI family transcriptional regulator n=1 Tax=Brachybacterium fresconis TaxID=173363 RepID=A0ABS4YQH2_9MICO|nr:LacI family DNA-binding transcriptional regulator [Brachybacterium fresconis]MBP2410188.1 LacI family transcriptional regulator [Brachybacterium fresconis]
MPRATTPRRVTIYDVAERAQLSHQTVSRYFRAPEGLRPATRERVSAAVTELGYSPNPLARSLRTGRSKRLMVVVPELTSSPARVLAGASDAARGAGFTLDVVGLTGDADERTDRLAELARTGRPEAILSLIPLAADAQEACAPVPLVVVGELDDAMRGIGELSDASPVLEFLRELSTLGHRRFLHITGDLDFASARARRDAYLTGIESQGLEDLGVVDGDWSAASGYEAIAAIDAARPPTAVIAANDVVAGGVVQGARERGWTIPEDLSVTGWDNLPLSGLLSPTLTTVEVDHEGVGVRAMQRLLERLSGAASAVPASEPVNTVIWRGSTGPVAGH